jgi:drug/metabolite transporter (DMT)-like permease
MTSHSNLRGIACVVLAAGSFVANDSCMKLVMADAPPLQVLFMRGSAAVLWCIPLLLILGYRADVRHIFNRWVALRGACEVFAVVSFVLALVHMPIADITAIYQISPLLLVAATALIWGERIGPLRIMLIVAGIAGALLVAQPGGMAASPYAIFGFATAIGAAARDVVSRKVPRHIPAVVVTFAMLVIVMLAAGLATGLFETWVAPQPQHLALMAAAGVFLIGGHFFIFLAFRYASAGTLAPFYYSFTIWALLAGFVIFGNVPNGLAVAGIMLILAAGLAVTLLDGFSRRLTAATGVKSEGTR